MLFIGRQQQRTCQTVTRRAFLQAGGSTVLGLSLADLLRCHAEEGSTPAGSARSVILVWLWGGPSQLDTWDPKPSAPLEYRGPFASIATRVPGMRVTELLPRLAAVADTFSLVRSVHTGSNDHGVAGTIGLTGSAAGAADLGGTAPAGTARAALGAVVARARGAGGPLPPYMVVGGRLHQGHKSIVGEGGGQFGALYDPFRVEYRHGSGFRVPALELASGLTAGRLGDRRRLLRALDQLDRHADVLGSGGAIDKYREQAFAMLTAPAARKVFDLSRESPRVLDRYGRGRFGRSCLLARRLAEHGVPFIQVNWSDNVEAEEDAGDGGWDHHYRNFQIMQDRHAPWLDQTLSALLSDLRQRGLLGKTMVLVLGEFGRSPKINAMAGRDHWEHCYSALVAGGGVHGGRVVGASDERGEQPRDNPVTPADLAATVHRCAGITSERAAILGLPGDGKAIEELF
ncbi:MAG TPA: DUF1501 domain-containing protein [Gemmataceae bacterium]|jgi:hypothetical protein|nr:DUF1501 domain-containing protein [Gemmataceae bacterium]